MGLDCSVTLTVLGWMVTLVVVTMPPESLAISWTSRYDGWLDSGASMTGVGGVLPAPTMIVTGALTVEAPCEKVLGSLTGHSAP